MIAGLRAILFMSFVCFLGNASTKSFQNEYALSIEDSLTSIVTFAKQSSKQEVSIFAVGDLMLAGSALPVFKEYGLSYAFDSIATVYQNADLRIANLEAPFTDRGRPFEKQYNFRMPPSFVAALQQNGIHVCTLANNHILDYGMDGLVQTLSVLDSAGISYCGAGPDLEEAEKGCVVVKNGVRIGILAYSLTYPAEFWANSNNGGTVFPEPDRLKRCITSMKKQSEFLIVAFHWGQERRETPKSYQRSYAHQVIDLGADLVIGHHPHVIQGIEIYKKVPVLYSLGNFIFGSRNYSCKTSIMARIVMYEKRIREVTVIPINVFNPEVNFQPRLFRGEEKNKVLEHINQISFELNKGRSVVNSQGLVLF